MSTDKKIILASASPRRKDLLSQCGYNFEIMVPNINEEPKENEQPSEMVLRLAKEKAIIIANQQREAIVIAADTTVAIEIDGNIINLGKPESHEDSKRMLRLISGKKHSVYTGVSIRSDSLGVEHSFIVKTDVYIALLSDEEIITYVATGEPSDKAGSYAAQGIGSKFIERIDGSFSNVVGLPLYETTKILDGLIS